MTNPARRKLPAILGVSLGFSLVVAYETAEWIGRASPDFEYVWWSHTRTEHNLNVAAMEVLLDWPPHPFILGVTAVSFIACAIGLSLLPIRKKSSE